MAGQQNPVAPNDKSGRETAAGGQGALRRFSPKYMESSDDDQSAIQCGFATVRTHSLWP